jgi:hypothetical protein
MWVSGGVVPITFNLGPKMEMNGGFHTPAMYPPRNELTSRLGES